MITHRLGIYFGSKSKNQELFNVALTLYRDSTSCRDSPVIFLRAEDKGAS